MRNAKQVRMRNTMVKAQASDQLTPVDHLVAQHWKLAEIFLLFFAALWNVVIKEVWNMDVNPNRFGTFHFAVWVNLIWSISYPAYCLLIFTLNLSVSAPALKQVIHKEPKLQFDNPWKCRLWNQGFTQSLHVLWMLVTPCTVHSTAPFSVLFLLKVWKGFLSCKVLGQYCQILSPLGIPQAGIGHLKFKKQLIISWSTIILVF